MLKVNLNIVLMWYRYFPHYMCVTVFESVVLLVSIHICVVMQSVVGTVVYIFMCASVFLILWINSENVAIDTLTFQKP